MLKNAMGEATLSQLLALWERHKGEVLGGVPGLLLEDAVGRYFDLRKAEGLSGDSFAQTKVKLERLTGAFGARALVSIGADDMRRWLSSTGFTGWSLVHHDKQARAFFSRAVREGWLIVSPMVKLIPPAKPNPEVAILSVKEGRRLFASLRDNPVSARLALEAFGGLRYSGAGRIEPTEIIWADRAIVIPASKSKDGKRYFLQGMPDNLWAWLERWRRDSRAWAPLSKRMLQYAKSGAFDAAGVINPGNGLRHSFCSYLIAWKKEASLCAYLMQHAAPDMLYRHYRGAANEADGKAWFEILP